MTFKRIGRAKYLYIKRPLYSYLYRYRGTFIEILFNGKFYRFLSGFSPLEQLTKTNVYPLRTYIPKHLVKPSIKPIAKHSYQQLRKDKFNHLELTSANTLQQPTSNTLLSVAGQEQI